MSMKGKDTLVIYQGDAHLYFEEGDEYTLSYLRQVFRKRTTKCEGCKEPIELFPHLVLQDADGRLWKPKLEVQLVPTERPEEDDE
jgi:hypothetical protein